ncbi:hypothetical protein [Burkholderia ubonensis]|uniref:hypothetical protein n=1 Tax=Burkholderia ubonensis TaxID=101571 RepID=UPI00075C65FC|nr:hypothetical protein [Burkholderia ubonensis]KVP75558.1 hypothetical protein WJ93_09370 [Burkholderia ubonensis]KVP97021.1 hypothetical protein WJ97_14475 [Burkholderia ubonensis]KVZ93069.1 hypothetical protein WL25_19235 [Burkholderia ubonensis]
MRLLQLPFRVPLWLVMGCLLLAGLAINVTLGLILFPLGLLASLLEKAYFALSERFHTPCLS